MRKAFIIAAALTAVTALMSCSAPTPELQSSSAGPPAYEPLAPVDRAPLSPPAGYAPHADAHEPPAPSAYAGAGPGSATPDGWRASPRWSAVKGDGCIEVEPDPRAGAGKVKVETCPEKTGPRTDVRSPE